MKLQRLEALTFLLVLGCGESTSLPQMTACTDGETCTESDCSTPCADASDNSLDASQLNSDGATQHDAELPREPYPMDGGIDARDCNFGQVVCDEATSWVKTCGEQGQWLEPEPCPQDMQCSEGVCVQNNCEPDHTTCMGNQVYRCIPSIDPVNLSLDEDCSASGLTCMDGRCYDEIEATRGQTCSQIECLSERSRELVCGRVIRDLMTSDASPFTPGQSQCDAGTLSDEGLEYALRLANLGRWLAGLPEAYLTDTLNPGAQACATIMANQRALSHDPPNTWACHSESGAVAAGESNIHLSYGQGSIEESVIGFYLDGGANNQADVGHRRWLQSPDLGGVGYGFHYSSSQGAAGSCYNVIGGPTTAPHDIPFIAYPSPGPFPRSWLTSRFWSIPWSVSIYSRYGSSWPSTESWTVEVFREENGALTPMPIQNLSSSSRWYGRTYAVVFTPSFDVAVGRYQIRVESAGHRFEWTSEIVDCL